MSLGLLVCIVRHIRWDHGHFLLGVFISVFLWLFSAAGRWAPYRQIWRSRFVQKGETMLLWRTLTTDSRFARMDRARFATSRAKFLLSQSQLQKHGLYTIMVQLEDHHHQWQSTVKIFIWKMPSHKNFSISSLIYFGLPNQSIILPSSPIIQRRYTLGSFLFFLALFGVGDARSNICFSI